ncbi:MAG: beta strand repeat-containing protein [Marmoricola sp.]
MASLQTKPRSALAVLAGALLVLTGFSAPAEAATARAVSLHVSPTLQYAGSAVTFSGNVSKSGANRVVKIQRKSGASWVAAGSTTTKNSVGAYSVKLNLPSTAATYSYRALAPATGSYRGAYSGAVSVTALRHTAVTIAATPTTIGTGGAASLHGTVSPFVSGGTVLIQKLAGSTWETDASTTIGSNGSYAASVSPSATTTYRAAVSRTGVNAGAQSSPTTVTVTQASPPTITTTSLPQGDKGVSYTATLTKAGGDGTWSISVGQLPAGLTLAPATGVISGTPSAGGTVNFTARFTETATGLSATKALSIVITPPPAITTTSLPDATQGAAYSATLTKTGNAGTWAVAGLPTGLSVNPTTGEISGVTTVAVGDYPVFPVFTETASGRNTAKSLSLHVAAGTVTPPDGPVITTTTLPNGSKGLAYSASLTKTGGAGTWSITGTLPPGITLDAATGALTGVPTLGGSFGFTAKFTETTGGKSVTKPLAIFVSAAPTITTTALPDAAKGAAYSFTLTKVGGAGTWSSLCGCGDPQTPQALPDGLVLNENTGVISGTPTVSGDYAIYVAFTETATGAYAYKGFALHISVPVITTTSVPDGTTGTAYSQQLNKTGLAGIWTYTGALPAGLTLSSSGLLAGTPTETGDFLFTATFTETSTGQSDQQPFLLHVSAPGSPTITTGSALPTATIGTPYSTTVSATPTGGTWTVSAGSLPVGFALNPTTGVISGNPLYKENALFILKYTKGATSNTKVFSLSVVAAPAG